MSQEELACSVLAEVIQCCALDVPKPYLATLVKLPLRLPVLATPETQVRKTMASGQRLQHCTDCISALSSQ